LWLADEPEFLVVEALASMVGIGGGFLQNGVCVAPFARDQYLPMPKCSSEAGFGRYPLGPTVWYWVTPLRKTGS